jgi:hypothetical protein
VSLTTTLHDRQSPVSRYLRARFPHVRDLQRRYREQVAAVVPLAPPDGVAVAYPTLGGALDWRLRLLLTPAPDLHLAFRGAAMLGERLRHLAVELLCTLGASVRLQIGPDTGPADPDPGGVPPSGGSRSA